MSLASIKAKESKGKKNALPKLKTILASPYKSMWHYLDDAEQQHIQKLLGDELKNSGLSGRAFAHSRHISIGLESVLRDINNARVSCVFISLTIKPRHVINLIARNSEVKNATAPVYALQRLEQFTEHMFGIQALTFALPVANHQLGTELQKWIAERQKKIPVKEVKSKIKIKVKKTADNKKDDNNLSSNSKISINSGVEVNNKCWSDNFISLGSPPTNMELDALHLEADRTRLQNVLSKITTFAETKDHLDVKLKTANELVSGKETALEDNSETDEFLDDYKALHVHKIRPNPDKKPKKKRKNKKRSSK